MARFMTFDESPGEQVASNVGWGDFVRWAEGLDSSRYREVVQLAEYGYTAVSPNYLKHELKAALALKPVDDELWTTIVGMTHLLDAAPSDADAVFVTDGFGPDDFQPTDNLTDNQFCATGKGGGINPHCSPGGGGVQGIGQELEKLRKWGGTDDEINKFQQLLKQRDGIRNKVKKGTASETDIANEKAWTAEADGIKKTIKERFEKGGKPKPEPKPEPDKPKPAVDPEPEPHYTLVQQHYVSNMKARREENKALVPAYHKWHEDNKKELDTTHAKIVKIGEKWEKLDNERTAAKIKYDSDTDAWLRSDFAGDGYKALREQAKKSAEEFEAIDKKWRSERDKVRRKAFDVLAAHTAEAVKGTGYGVLESFKTTPKTAKKEVLDDLIEFESLWGGVFSERHKDALETTEARYNGGRAHYKGYRHGADHPHVSLSGGQPHVAAHEYGHAIETSRAVHNLAWGFLYSRVGNEHLKHMGAGYEQWEVGRDDRFADAVGKHAARYVGKHYNTNDTEVISMGMEHMHKDPVRFAQRDPEFFKLILGVVSGRY